MRRRDPQRDAAQLLEQAIATRESLESIIRTVGALRAESAETLEELRTTRAELQTIRSELADARTYLMDGIKVAAEDEATMRRLLREVRASADYEAAWSDPEPLVSIVLPTHERWELLEKRALPSVLAQTYPRIEVVVVGDSAPPEMAEAISRIGDPRVRYENLGIRGPYPEELPRRWFVAGTNPVNRAMQLARGAWTAWANDDDEMYPEHVETLLAAARSSHAEVAYGKLRQIAPDGSTSVLGAFPPGNHTFGWQLALQHSGLRIFEYELSAAVFDEPGDWHRTRRMLRAGVRFSQIDRVTSDYYPNSLWHH